MKVLSAYCLFLPLEPGASVSLSPSPLLGAPQSAHPGPPHPASLPHDIVCSVDVGFCFQFHPDVDLNADVDVDVDLDYYVAAVLGMVVWTRCECVPWRCECALYKS